MKQQVLDLLQQALNGLRQDGIVAEDLVIDIQVQNSKSREFGDLASNLAMVLAKPCKRNPREIAVRLKDALPASSLLKKVEVAGPGFLNFFIDDQWLQAQVDSLYGDDRQGVPAQKAQTIVVDYSSPNLAKEMHVGHLRSTVIGDAVVRVLEFLGHDVIRQNHVGDWGTQFGMLLAHMQELKVQGLALKQSLSDLESFYRTAKKRFDEDRAFATKARQLVVRLQGGEADILALWKEFNDISLSHCQTIYDRLGVTLSRQDVQGESAYNDDLDNVVEDLDARGLLEEDQGAACVFLDEFRNKEGDPLPVIVRKKDGGYLYATTDLAAIRYRVQQLGIDRALYFVDARQALHFEQVFTVARKAGFVNDGVHLEHMPFGTVMGEDGKPYKSRSGEVAKLADLLDEAEIRAIRLVADKNPEMTLAKQKQIGSVVGLASVKYADLSKNRSSDYLFSFDKMLSFDGNTAPYLLYAYTRIRSIFRKLKDAPDLDSSQLVLASEKEIELAGKLLQFSPTVQRVGERGYPHNLCSYLYELAVLFSAFYEACPILKADDSTTRNSRLKLASLVADTLRNGLSLIGIDVLEQM